MNRDEFISKLFARAKEQGFDACEVYCAGGSEFNCGVFKGEIVEYSSADSQGIGFRGLYNGRMGYASTQVMDEDAVDFLVDGAKTNAELIENDDEEFIFEGSGEYTPVDTYVPELENVTAAQKLDVCRRIEEKTLSISDKVTQAESTQVFSGADDVTIVNTRGLNVTGRSNYIGAYVIPVAKDGDKVNTALKFKYAQDINEIRIDEMAEKAVEEAVSGLNAASIPSGTMNICIRNSAMAALLSTFSGVFSAEAAQKDMSLLKGREGDTVAAECISILDNPHMPGMMASGSFDGEGVATKFKRVIDAGKLTTLLHNLKTAKKQGVETTANASRPSYSSTVGIAPSNFYIEPSDKALDALLAEMGEGILITDLEGMHASANVISGDFSLAAKGYLVKDGRIANAVREITVADNFYKLLMKATGVADDLYFGFPGSSCFGSPTVRFDSVAVAGSAE